MSTQFRPEQADLTKYWDFGSGTMRVPAGTSFPAGPGDGDTYYRTDEDLLYIYDGAGWARIQNQAVDVAIEQVGSPTYEDVQDWINTTQSAGLISGGAGTATSYAIATADDVAETFTIAGDVTVYFTNGVVFTVSGSTGNDGDYTTVGNSTYAGGVTTITVADVPDGTDDGNIADGRVDAALGAGMIKKTDDAIDGVTAFFDWPATPNILLVDNKVNWIYATYGGGTPAVAATDDHSTIDFTTEFVIFVVYREGTVLHIMQAGLYIFDAFRSMARRVRELRRIERASGAIISNEGTLKIKVTAAVLYSVMTRITTSEVDTSGAGRFRAWYHDGGGNWTSTGYPADQTDIDSANYDTGTGLAAIAAARYGVYWVFLDFDSHLHIVYGVASYKLYEAQAAEMPAIPDICSEFSVLVARVIAFKDAAEITEVASAFVTTFLVATAASHDDLADLEIITGGHTLTGAKWDLVGATALNTLGLLTPSDDVSAGAEAILKSTAAGDLALHSLTATGFVNVGTATEATIAGQIAAKNLTVETTGTFYGIYGGWTKTAGDTDAGDHFYGVRSKIAIAHADAIGMLIGGYFEAKLEEDFGASAATLCVGLWGATILDRGAIAGNVSGLYYTVDVDAAVTSIGGDVYGIYIFADIDTDPVGSAYMLYLDEATGIDYGIYQSGTAPNLLGGDLTVALGLNVGTTLGVGMAAADALTVLMAVANQEGITIQAVNAAGALSQPGLRFNDDAGNEIGNIYADVGTGEIRITNSGDAIVIDNSQNVWLSGALDIGNPGTAAPLRVKRTTAGFTGFFYNDGDNNDRTGVAIRCGKDDASGDNQTLIAQDGDGDVQGYLTIDDGVFELNQGSDRRRKKDLVLTGSVLDRLRQVKVMDFNWRDKAPGARHTGFVAQQLHEHFPLIGKYNEETDWWGVSPLRMIPINTKGIQELDSYRLATAAEIDAIREQIGILENQLALLNRAA